LVPQFPTVVGSIRWRLIARYYDQSQFISDKSHVGNGGLNIVSDSVASSDGSSDVSVAAPAVGRMADDGIRFGDNGKLDTNLTIEPLKSVSYIFIVVDGERVSGF